MTITYESMMSNVENPQIPSSKQRKSLKKLIILNLITLVVSSLALAVRIYTNVSSARKKRQHDRWSYFVFQMVVMVVSMINAVLGLALAIYEGLKQPEDQRNYKLFNVSHLILNILGASLFSLLFMIEFIRWCADLLHDDQVRNGVRLVVIVLALVITLSQIACAIENRVLAWSPQYHYSRLVLCFSSTILIGISIASINFNVRIHRRDSDAERSAGVPHWSYTTFQASSSYTLVCGLIGVVLTFLYGRKESGPNQFQTRLRQFFNVFCTIGALAVIIFTIILWLHQRKSVQRTKFFCVDLFTGSNLLLSIVQCTLLFFNVISLHRLVRARHPDRNGLTIERIRLSESLLDYVAHWAVAIDRFNDAPEGMTGEAALQLMKAYENGQLENTECLVLRIGRPNRRVLISNNLWDDTEALVLLTIVHHYDAMGSANFDGFWGTVLKRTLGTENCTERFRPLLLRFGLIGFQWPFRTSIFFTAHHHDPLTRAANVLKTIVDWNEMQKSRTHCNVLLLPTLSTEPTAKAISIASFFPLHFPPTHLLDLRPHRGKTWPEYMKTLKKGNRRPYIQQFLSKGGTIEEVHDLSRSEVGEAVCEQWANIARLRCENKEQPTLAKPSVGFISSMGHAMSTPYRSVVFLRFNNEVIASSVIYKFPAKLITTDIQGLTHAKARPLKAYFVMLQWVIKEALDKKYDFVDFGPTTPGPKIDLGCTSVPLEVGGYAGNPILAFGIQQAGNALDAIHKKTNNLPQDDSEPNAQPPIESKDPVPDNSFTDAVHQNSSKKQKQVKNDPSTNRPV